MILALHSVDKDTSFKLSDNLLWKHIEKRPKQMIFCCCHILQSTQYYIEKNWWFCVVHQGTSLEQSSALCQGQYFHWIGP